MTASLIFYSFLLNESGVYSIIIMIVKILIIDGGSYDS